MAKIFETSADISELAHKKFEETGLQQMGVTLKVMSLTKAKDVLKVSRANATTEFLTKKSDVITLYVYEDVFDRLTDAQKEMIMEGVLSNVSYDGEKDKLIIDNRRYGELARMKHKFPDYADVLELTLVIMDESIEEGKARKEEEREAKKLAKKNRQ